MRPWEDRKPGLILSVFHSLWRNQSSWLSSSPSVISSMQRISPQPPREQEEIETQTAWVLIWTWMQLSGATLFWTVQLHADLYFLHLDSVNCANCQGSRKDWEASRRNPLLDWEQMSREPSGSVPLCTKPRCSWLCLRRDGVALLSPQNFC